MQDEKNNLEQELNQARKKYRFITEQLKLYKEQELEYNKKLKQYMNAEERFRDCRASASYKLGHLLIHETKSFSSIIQLPKKIFAIKKLKTNISLAKQNTLSTKKTNISEVKDVQILDQTKAISNKVSKYTLSDIENLKAKQLVVATVMDDFSFTSYKYECSLNQLSPNNWKNELIEIKPELLLIESAWRGKDDLWGSKIGHKSQELIDIIAYCNENNIPTAFWNKEDPIHFQTFINIANLFDFIFTTDVDMIEQYKALLNHNNVYLLPFAAQPKFNNPIEKYERKDAFCFAGAYYVKYPERTKDLGNFVLSLSEKYDIDIYDRNYGKNDENYMFPKTYKPFIVGTLAFEEIDKAYKGYNFAINLNSIKQSQTMFARRVYELLASNTITISNFSKGVRLFFGDLVITTDNEIELLRRVDEISKDNVVMKKIKLLALRNVMKQHTYQDRFAYICEKVFNLPKLDLFPTVMILSKVSTQNEYDSIIENYKRQDYKNKNIIIVSDKTNLNTIQKFPIINFKEFIKIHKEKFKYIEYISFFSINDYYGKNYLLDLVLATRYSEYDAISKSSFYTKEEKLFVSNKNEEYTETDSINIRRSLLNKKLFDNKMINNIDKYTLQVKSLGIDSFNYAQNSQKLDNEDLKVINDIENINNGVEFETLLKQTENIKLAKNASTKLPCITGKKIAENMDLEMLNDVNFNISNDLLIVDSNLADKTHQYIYSNQLFTLQELNVEDVLKIFFETSPGLNISLVCVYQDKNRNKLHHEILIANKNYTLKIPSDTVNIKFGLRIYSGGNCEVKNIFLEHKELAHSFIVGQSKHLVLTNNYPSYNDLYRNGFVHTRVRAYQREGVNVDVFKLRMGEKLEYDEFENVDVLTGDQQALDNLLKTNQYSSILVHFLDEEMWKVIEKYIEHTKIIIWVHGAEIQPWYRRKYNYTTDKELSKAKKISDTRMLFWKKVLEKPHENLKLVFVSKYFEQEVQEDLNLIIPEKNKTIIHNYIDTNLFNYIPKDIEQRTKILSIRPYASRTYANDLSVEAIFELSKKPYFKKLEFHLMGDGVLFEETLELLRKFSNVKITRCFLSHNEISTLHKKYGIFLTPTRMDTQGVSRGEAMSSGLVPVTNRVTAIPEFVDESCGILADGDDAHGLAKGIARLYENPELFQKMSEAAAKRVREQCGYQQTILKELNLFI